jgi:hypothetical protein
MGTLERKEVIQGSRRLLLSVGRGAMQQNIAGHAAIDGRLGCVEGAHIAAMLHCLFDGACACGADVS